MLKVGRHHQRHGGVGLLSETSTHSTTLQLQNLQKEHNVDQELFKRDDVPETYYSFSSERILALGLVTLGKKTS